MNTSCSKCSLCGGQMFCKLKIHRLQQWITIIRMNNQHCHFISNLLCTDRPDCPAPTAPWPSSGGLTWWLTTRARTLTWTGGWRMQLRYFLLSRFACDLPELPVPDGSVCLFQEERQSRREESQGDDLFRWDDAKFSGRRRCVVTL